MLFFDHITEKSDLLVTKLNARELSSTPEIRIKCSKNKQAAFQNILRRYKKNSDCSIRLGVGDSAQANFAFFPIFNKKPAHSDLLSSSLGVVYCLGTNQSDRQDILSNKNKYFIWNGEPLRKTEEKIPFLSSVKSPTSFEFDKAVKYIEFLQLAYSTKLNNPVAAAQFSNFLTNIVKLWELFVQPKAIDQDVIKLITDICGELCNFNYILFPAALSLKFNVLLAAKFSLQEDFTTAAWSTYELEATAKLPNLDEVCKKINPSYKIIKIPQNHRIKKLKSSEKAAYINLRTGWQKPVLVEILEYLCGENSYFTCFLCNINVRSTSELLSHFEKQHKIMFNEIFKRRTMILTEVQKLSDSLQNVLIE